MLEYASISEAPSADAKLVEKIQALKEKICQTEDFILEKRKRVLEMQKKIVSDEISALKRSKRFVAGGMDEIENESLKFSEKDCQNLALMRDTAIAQIADSAEELEKEHENLGDLESYLSRFPLAQNNLSSHDAPVQVNKSISTNSSIRRNLAKLGV